jgi:hypothetical protein
MASAHQSNECEKVHIGRRFLAKVNAMTGAAYPCRMALGILKAAPVH